MKFKHFKLQVIKFNNFCRHYTLVYKMKKLTNTKKIIKHNCSNYQRHRDLFSKSLTSKKHISINNFQHSLTNSFKLCLYFNFNWKWKKLIFHRLKNVRRIMNMNNKKTKKRTACGSLMKIKFWSIPMSAREKRSKEHSAVLIQHTVFHKELFKSYIMSNHHIKNAYDSYKFISISTETQNPRSKRKAEKK